jgi:tetratricopeptide (TPR) repeat protein
MPRLPQHTGFLLLLLSGVMLAAPAFADDLRSSAPVEARKASSAGEALAPTTPEVKAGLAGSFLASRFARSHQDLNEAAKYLKTSLEHDPKNTRLMHEAMRMSLLAGNIPEAIDYAKKLSDDAKSDALVATLLMLDAVKAEKYDLANKFVEEAPGGGLYGIVRPVMTEWVSIMAGDVVGKADLQAAIDKAGFFAPFITYHMALMNDVLGNDHAALEAYLKASTDPASTPYRVVEALANFYMRQGKWDEAQKIFDNYARANPDSTLLPDKLVPTKIEVTPLVADGKDGLAELFFTTASILFGEESTQDTFLYLRIALELKPNLPPAQLMLANLYEQVGDYKQAIATYDAMAKDNVFYRRGQVRKALNLEAMGRRDEAIAQLDKQARQYKNDPLALITKADMLREKQQYEEAAVAYTQALERSEPLTESDWPLLYARGISYERAGSWENA